MTKNTLTLVNVDTASSPGGGHELVLQGLKDPQKFKSDVWAMKRGEIVQGAIEVPGDDMAMDRGMEMQKPEQPVKSSFFGGGGSKVQANESETVSLIAESNTLLREQNAILQKILMKK